MKRDKKTVHMIGNAHIDPVWLWRFGDGLAEIKATFRSALDRIKEYDEFIFTSACAFYYQWVEENCPELFEEIQQAVVDGRWKIVGGMWIQPDCNMPSSESFARHLLYSQHYFYEKFGVIAKTGYNVDSFGHSAGLPALLRQGKIENYVYMRPANDGAEMEYPFPSNAFHWQYGDDEVVAFHLNDYCTNLDKIEIKAPKYEGYADASPTDFMMFYGVGNHGGGPTIKQIEYLLDFRKNTKHKYVFSDPDTFFDSLRQTGQVDVIPAYRGELQNHASGCYAANSEIKRLNRRAESILGEAEILSAMSSKVTPYRSELPSLQKAWKAVLFNQFHDILCGCCLESALKDASAFMGGAIGEGLKQSYSATQRIAWSIDTSKGVPALSKDQGIVLWEQDNLGTPVVIFNPLSHTVRLPVSVTTFYDCASVTDENDNAIPFQKIYGTYAKNAPDVREKTFFMAELPPMGWRTYWHYRYKEHPLTVTPPTMIAEEHRLANDRLEVLFDEKTGEIRAIRTHDGKDLLGSFASRAIVIDDTMNDTWSHGKFVFDQQIGSFGDPTFTIMESGCCQVSLRVRQGWSGSTLEQIYTLYAGDDRLHVSSHVTLNDPTVSVKLCFDSGMTDAEWIREIPGGVITAPQNGREMPMLRYMATKENNRLFAIVNDSKYSCSAKDGELRMIIARSCYFADHFGQRHESMRLQDMGEQAFSYVIVPNAKTLTRVVYTAEELHTEWIVVPETYHEGPLPQVASHWHCDAPNVSLTAWKDAEDGNGTVLRITETEGIATECTATLMGTDIPCTLAPYQIKSFRLTDDGAITPCDFLEWEITQ